MNASVADRAPRNIVALCDGTANHLGTDLSNVARIFRCLRRSDDQRVFYTPGVGTIGADMWWAERARRAKAMFEQATGYSIDRDILSIYRFLCEAYVSGDRIFLLGFSRGAYTVRIVAALIHMVGLLQRDQLNLAGYALRYLKAISAQDGEATKEDFDRVFHFARIAEARPATVWFLGLFDTVSSLILPGRNGPFPGLATLPYTRRNPSVQMVRHAAAIDERRVMFRLNRWDEPQPFLADRFAPRESAVPQDVKQVWFSGVHGDVGGGYPEAEAQVAKIPLLWMLREAEAEGLLLMRGRLERYVLGQERSGNDAYVEPSSTGALHDSLKGMYRVLEWVPKARRFAETRRPRWPLYLPRSELRDLTRTRPRPLVHASVLEQAIAGYRRPPNLPLDGAIEVEPWHPQDRPSSPDA